MRGETMDHLKADLLYMAKDFWKWITSPFRRGQSRDDGVDGWVVCMLLGLVFVIMALAGRSERSR